MEKVYYVLKVKGKARIPDYIQVRDEQFSLIGYFRPEHRLKHQATARSAASQASQELFFRIEEAAANIPYSRITRIVLD